MTKTPISTELLAERIVAVKELLLAKCNEHEEKDILRHQSENLAANKTAVDISRRLAEMNHFREQLISERATYLTKEVYEREHGELQRRVTELESVRNTETGKDIAAENAIKHRNTTTGIVISIGTALVAVAIALLHYYH